MTAAKLLDAAGADRVAMSRGSGSAAGLAGVGSSSAGPSGPARTGAKPLPVLPHWRDPAASWLCIKHRGDAGARVRLEMRRLGFEVHWPRETIRVRGRDDVISPFFRGYLFALPESPRASWHAVQEKGQLGIFVVGVKEFGRPSHPPPGFVLGLIERAGGAIDGVIPAPEDAAMILRRDDPVRLLSGPFAGHVGLFQAERGKRVSILLNVLGVETRVDVRPDRLVRVD